MALHARQRRFSRMRQHAKKSGMSLHLVTFKFAREGGFVRMTTIPVRGRMDWKVAMKIAADEAAQQGKEPWLTDIRTVRAPRATPALDAICRQHTAFRSFLALVSATAGYTPSIRLDRMGRDGLKLAAAYDKTQASWGDSRRAFVTGHLATRPARIG